MTDINTIFTNAIVNDINHDYLLVAAKHNHIELVKLIINTKTIDDLTYSNVFLNFCAFGHLESAKWILTINSTIRDTINNSTLDLAINNGHLSICEWLFDIIRDIDNEEELFIRAVSRGHLELAKWLHTKCDPITLNKLCPDIFWQACISGNILMTDWILDIVPSIMIVDKYVCLACELGHLELAKWLYERNSSMKDIDGYTMNKIISKGYDEIIVWIVETFPSVEVSLIGKSSVSDDELLEWIQKNGMEPTK